MSMANIKLNDLSNENMPSFRRINSVVLQATYSESWYKKSLEVGQLAKLAVYNDIYIGGIRCALEMEGSLPVRIYIMTIAVLAPYRHCGAGTQLLNHIIEQAKKYFVHEIYVHVWTENTEGIEWYNKKGFVKVGLADNYYQKMCPPNGAWVMSLGV